MLYYNIIVTVEFITCNPSLRMSLV